jgi:GDP-D-mannose dehydratase
MYSVVITGAEGSGGSYLSEYLLSLPEDIVIFAPSRWRGSRKNNPSVNSEKFKRIECDLTDLSSVIRFFEIAKPSIVFNLASHANVRASFDVPLAVFENNTRSTHNILEALRILNLKPTFIQGSTFEVYGNPKIKHLSVAEDQKLDPVSPYAASKVAQEMLALSYFHSFEIPIVITRMATYLNSRRSDLFATAFATQLLKMKECGKVSKLEHGNLNSVRTILDIRDACSAYWVAAMKCKIGETYNIAGSITMKVGDMLNHLMKHIDIYPELVKAPSLIRSADVNVQLPNSEKFRNATGWKENYDFNESFDYFIKELQNNIKN